MAGYFFIRQNIRQKEGLRERYSIKGALFKSKKSSHKIL